MADEVADAVIAVHGDTKPFEQAMDRAAAKSAAVSKTVSSQWIAAAQKLNNNPIISQLETVSSLFIQVGGNVSQVASVVASSIRPIATLGAVLGPSAPLALGLLALPAAGFGAVGALKGVANAGIEAEDELRKLSLVTEKSANKELKEYKNAAGDLSIVLNELKVAAGSAAAPAITEVVQALAAGIRAGREAYDTLYPLLDVLHEIGRVGMFIGSAGLTEVGAATISRAANNNDAAESYEPLLKAMSEASKKAAEQGNLWTESQAAFDEMEDAADALAVAREQQRVNAEAAEKAERALLKAIAEAIAQDQVQLGLIAQKNEALILEKEAKQAASDEELRLIEEDRQAYFDYYRDRQAWAQETADIEKELAEQQKRDLRGAADAIVDYVQTMLSTLEQLAAAQVNYYQQLSRDNTEAAEAAAASQREAFEAYAEMKERRGEALTDHQIELWNKELDARTAAASGLSQAERTAALEAWNKQQSYAEAQAVLSGIQMGISFVEALAPILGPAAIPIGLAAAAGFIGTQLQLINTAQPPEFPVGRIPDRLPSRSPDHHLVGVRDDELILTPRGSREFKRMNRGQGASSTSGAMEDLLRQIRDLLRPARGPGLIVASAGRRR